MTTVTKPETKPAAKSRPPIWAVSRATKTPSTHLPPSYKKTVRGEDGEPLFQLCFEGDGRPLIVDEREHEACRDAIEGGLLLEAHVSPSVAANLVDSAVSATIQNQLRELEELRQHVAKLEAELEKAKRDRADRF